MITRGQVCRVRTCMGGLILENLKDDLTVSSVHPYLAGVEGLCLVQPFMELSGRFCLRCQQAWVYLNRETKQWEAVPMWHLFPADKTSMGALRNFT